MTTIVAQPSRELTEFLLELAVASQRRAMYPGGHPSLESSEQRVVERLGGLLVSRQTLTVGVARDQLIIDGVATDSRNNLLRALAGRMHAHRIAGLKFIPGLTPIELADLLTRLAREADGSLMEPNWAHLQLYRQAYDRLTLVEDEPGANKGEPRRVPRAAQLWLALAQAALNVAADAAKAANTDPKAMAEAINQHTTMKSTDAYEQVVVGYLLQIADELRSTDGTDTAALRGRVSSLVANLSPEALQRLLVMGGDLGQRRAFLLDATAGMAVEAVLAIAVAAANVSRRVISQPLMRMLVKLASHAQRGAPPLRAATDAAFRDQVRELIEGWTLPDPTSDAYSKALDDLSRPVDGSPIISGITQVAEPERIFEISLDLRNTAPTLWDAIDALIARGDITYVLDTLDRCLADNPLPGVIRTRIATPAHFRLLLGAPTVDVKRIGDFARRVGEPATELLLDALIESNSRAARRRILEVLGALGEGIGPSIVRRLPGAPWYAQRNLLILMNTLEVWPDEFTASDYAGHEDVRVRREALKLLLKRASTRLNGIIVAVSDSDAQLIRMGLDAALRECPPAVVPRLTAKLAAGTLPPELETMAIQAIGSTSVPAAYTCLWGLAVKRTRWLRRDKLAPKSRAMLAALAALAKRWSEDPKVMKIVAKAARSGDREIRRAVGAPQ